MPISSISASFPAVVTYFFFALSLVLLILEDFFRFRHLAYGDILGNENEAAPGTPENVDHKAIA
jgi:hypothetical protein